MKNIANLDIINKQIIIDYEKEDGKLNAELKKTLDKLEKDKKVNKNISNILLNLKWNDEKNIYMN